MQKATFTPSQWGQGAYDLKQTLTFAEGKDVEFLLGYISKYEGTWSFFSCTGVEFELHTDDLEIAKISALGCALRAFRKINKELRHQLTLEQRKVSRTIYVD